VESKKEEKERAFYTILDTARFVMLLVLKKLQKMMGLGWSLSLSLSVA
jgi:predicted sugar kinase